MNISYEGIGHLSVTVPAGTAVAGKVCKLGAAGNADVCAAGDRFCGVAETVETGMAAVQLEGFVTVSYSGDSAPAVGYETLSADGNGGVKVDNSNGTAYLVAAVDTVAKTAVIKL